MNNFPPSESGYGTGSKDGRHMLSPSTIVDLPEHYRPSPDEEYMSAVQLAYFREKLRLWRSELEEESRQMMDSLREEIRDVGDDIERATREIESALAARTHDRCRQVIMRIDGALRRIQDGRYGYCDDTGEEIGVDRLVASPIATLCLDAQERSEYRKRYWTDR